MASPNATPPTERLALYAWLSRFPFVSYRVKLLAVAFVGTHVPLLALLAWMGANPVFSSGERLVFLVVVVVATLVGTAFTLFVSNQLLRPVWLTASALRNFREHGRRSALPTCFDDEVGSLMTDAQRTIEHLGARLEAMAHLDEITGLPNRKRFEQLLHGRTLAGQPFAVGLIRFSNHTTVVETLGRAAANEATQLVAARIARRAECEDALASVGPDMFAFVLSIPALDSVWLDAANRVRSAVEASAGEIPVGTMTVAPVLFGGIAVFPQDATDPVQLVDNAILAASHANVHAPVMLHSAEAKRAALARFRLEHELRRALDHDEFELHFQPVVDVLSSRTVGAEALIRWRHPDRGLQLPGSFVPLAEANGLIEPMDRWVLRRACQQLRDWNRTRPERLQLAINLSARQFRDPLLSRYVLAAIEEFGISPEQLELELTETAAMADQTHTQKVFTQLRDAGVKIAIDDFGTGYSSMSYLRRLPFDKLKIDREFVSGVDHTRHGQAICCAMIELARGLGLVTLAEGTETAREVQFLADRGCSLFQGYFFSKPVSSLEFLTLLDRRYEFALPAGEHGSQPVLSVLS